jgi:hypothetical protein
VEVVLRDPQGRKAPLLHGIREADDLKEPVGPTVGRILIHDGERAQTHVATTARE